ncbi:IS3 family transposase [Rhodovulum sp. MB263]|uniref:IS3 family transposase n=1 Tax=Rhodovulum sp. (strain MB263) TaxID=308754 RepID=UPI0012DAFDA4|nr:IS3 family transposase [Rhodovulum sp. MB263]
MDRKKNTTSPYPAEFRERAVQMVIDPLDSYASLTGAVRDIAGKLGCSPDSLRVLYKQARRDSGKEAGPTSAEKARIRELERGNRELWQANEILKKASACFGPGGARPPVPQMTGFIDEFREEFGVEPICRVPPVASSTYHARKAAARDPSRASPRMRRDAGLKDKIREIWSDNRKLYGARKVWHALKRDNVAAARCTVERLMRAMGLQGVIRGKKVITTNPDTTRPCPDDKVNREFRAERPNQLWVSDFTCVPTWSGTVYVAFVIDVFARRIVGWRVSTSMTTQVVLDAPEQAIWQRKPPGNKGLIHRSERGSQYLSVKYTEGLADADVDPSVGSVGDSYDNALAESVIGLFKTGVIKQFGPWKTMQDVERGAMHWVDWHNNERFLGSIGYIPQAEAERRYLDRMQPMAKVA